MDDKGSLFIYRKKPSLANSRHLKKNDNAATYKPVYPRHPAAVVAENIIFRTTDSPPAVRSRNQKDDIEADAQRHSPVLLELIPVARVDFFGHPEEEIQGIQVGLDALEERLAAHESGHGEKRVARPDVSINSVLRSPRHGEDEACLAHLQKAGRT